MCTADTNPGEQERKSRIRLERGIPDTARLVMKTCYFFAALMAVMVGMPLRNLADPPLVYNVENTGTNFTGITNLPPLSRLPLVQPLPDPFMWLSAYTNRTFDSRSTNFVDWEQH